MTRPEGDSGIRLDPEALKRFADLIRSHRGKRISERGIWDAFGRAFPHRPMGQMERQWLRAALDVLATQGLVEFPAARSSYWDRSMDPVLPQMVTRVEAPAPRDDAWRRLPWHPELAWVPVIAYLSQDQVLFLRRVHEGLVNGWFRIPAPLRYRSLQLTGHEKRLEQHLGTTLFGEGRLSPQMLNFYHDVLPLAWERVGPGGRVLVFENSAPFSVARAVLSGMDRPPYGIVAYGGGRAFTESVEYLRTLRCEIASIDYVGDLDEPGLKIAIGARETARRAGGLPDVRPAPGLHAVMLSAARQFGHPAGWRDLKRTELADPAAAEFLPADVRRPVVQMIAAGRRIPEEVLGPQEMYAAWADV